MSDETSTLTQSIPSLREEVLRALYPLILTQLQVDGKRKLLLVGARGFGKSLVLHDLVEETRRQNNAQSLGRIPPLVLDGRSWVEALKELKDLAEVMGGDETLDEKTLPDFFFDDFDLFVQNVDTLRRERCEAMLRHFSLVVSTLARRDRRCVVTSTLSQKRLQDLLLDLYKQGHVSLSVVTAASTFFATFDCVWLDPWREDWRGRVRQLIDRHLPALSPEGGELTHRLLLELTGGHPALLARAFEHMERLLTSQGSFLEERLTRGGAEPRKLEEHLRSFLEDALRRQGIGSLRRALVRLETAEKPELRAAHAVLLAFAQGGGQPPPPSTRDILLDEGLLFRDPADSTYQIPGDLLRQELASAVGATLSLHLAPDEVEPDARGRLEIREGARHQDVELSAGAWGVLKVLFEAAPRFVSLKGLQQQTHLRTDNAVRSAIQRLIAELRRVGLEGLVENQYGKGYRKGESPSWSPKA